MSRILQRRACVGECLAEYLLGLLIVLAMQLSRSDLQLHDHPSYSLCQGIMQFACYALALGQQGQRFNLPVTCYALPEALGAPLRAVFGTGIAACTKSGIPARKQQLLSDRRSSKCSTCPHTALLTEYLAEPVCHSRLI